MRVTWKRRGDVCRSARLIYWPVCIKMTGQGASLKQAEPGSEKYHLCEGCAFIPAYFHPLAESRRRRGKPRLKSPVASCDTWWCKDQQWNCLFSSLRLRLHIISGTKRSHTSPPRGPWTHLYATLVFCLFFMFLHEKRKEFNQKGKLPGEARPDWRLATDYRRTEGWLDKQGQTCCLAARRSCSGGGDADRTWY